MKPFFSIIIPYHNSEDTIGRLLNSVAKSKKAPAYEVIVVDDGSEDPYNHYNRYKNYKSYRVIRLTKNLGPAVARNRGVKIAKGKFVVFLDSDVELFGDTLYNLYKIYSEDPDIVAVTGVWVKEQRSKAFFPNFKALRDWSYWINERDKSGYYYLFSTRIASIKRTVFQRLGGFNEKYPAPLVEDIELTYRIARRYAIIFAPNVRVRHEFESFWPIAKKYFLRAYYWTKLYQTRKKFDPVATTWQEAITTISGVATVVLGFLSLLLSPMLPVMSNVKCPFDLSQGGQMSNVVRIFSCYYPFVIWNLSLVILFLHLFLIRKFLVFLYQEKGLVFAVKGFFIGLVLYCFIFAGALWGRISLVRSVRQSLD
ncbi:glycosyltransferase family 2 protein [Candidatus Gottesmanbacteria bacterium]|nr:glycosyltransferase family 2 protein [Candidatus Gottesmanbacteria bacterium]